MATFEEGTWVWMPDPEEQALPAKVLSTFKAGEDAKLRTEDGEDHKLTGAETKDITVADPEVLSSKIDNLINLNDLNENAILHNLRIRFKESIIYTNVSSILVSVNPFKLLPLYTPEIMDKYRQNAREQPPHVFQVADEAYRGMLAERKNQSIIISGESGAGKSEATKLMLQYIAEVSSRASGQKGGTGSLEQQILQANPVMEAFGNAKTVRNNNSSRFGKLITVKFDSNGAISGGSIINYLLEKSRVVFQSEGERNYHIFYQLISGCKADKELSAKMTLADAVDYHYLDQSGVVEVEGINDEKEWNMVRRCFTTLGFSEEDVVEPILRSVAAVLHLGNVQFDVVKKPMEEDSSAIGNEDIMNLAASLLAIDPATLKTNLISKNIGNRSTLMVAYSVEKAQEARDALVKAIYGNLFQVIIDQINKSLQASATASGVANIIGVLDIFGFESFEKNSFEQLCINFCNEKLQFHFNEHIFRLEQEVYEAEGVNVPRTDFKDNQPTLDLLELKGTGLFPMLDEEIQVPRASDDTYLRKIQDKHAKHANFVRTPASKLKIPNERSCFGVIHYAGPVYYDVTNFLEKNKDQIVEDVKSMIKKSTTPFVARLMADGEEGGAAEEPKSKVRSRGGAGGAKKKSKTLGGQFKASLTSLMDTLNATEPSFVRTVKPNSKKVGGLLEADMVLSQLRYSGLLEVCRIRKLGFPVRRDNMEFYKRYRVIEPSATDLASLLEKVGASGKLAEGTFALGKTKVFLKNKAAQDLDSLREDAFVIQAIKVQKVARRYVCRVKMASWKVTLAAVAAAMASRNEAELSAAMDLMNELPSGGRHLQVYKDANILLQRLIEEKKLLAMLESAIESRSKAPITSAIEAAKAMVPPFEHELLGKAQSVLERIAKEEAVTEGLRKACKDRDLAAIDSLLAQAEELEMGESEEVKQAEALKKRLEEENTALEGLAGAMEARDMTTLAAFIKMCSEMGLSNPEVAKGKTLLEELQAKVAAKNSLTEAVTSRSLDAITSALAKAKAIGVDDAEALSSAEALIETIKKEQAAVAALVAACDARTLDALEKALSDAAAAGLTEATTPEVATAETLKNSLVAESACLGALNKATAANDSDALGKALAEAQQLGLTGAEVDAANAAYAKLAAANSGSAKLVAICTSDSIADIVAALAEADALGLQGESAYSNAVARKARLEEEQTLMADLDAAMTKSDLQALSRHVATCMRLGISNKYPEQMAAAKAKANELGQQQQVIMALSNSIRSKDLGALEAALERAASLGINDTEEVTKAIAMKERLLKEQALEATMTEAMHVLNNNPDDADAKQKLKTAYDEATALEMTTDRMQQARVQLDRDQLIAETEAKVKQATESMDLHMLNEALEAAIQLGLRTPTIEAGTTFRDELAGKEQFVNQIVAACETLKMKAGGKGGITASDVEALNSKLAEAADVVEAMSARQEIQDAKALQVKMSEVLKVQDMLKACAAKGSACERTELFTALSEARELEMDMDIMVGLSKTLKELDAEYQKQREKEDAPLEDDGAYEDATKQAEERNAKAEQKKYAFSNYPSLRTPDDFAKGVLLQKRKLKEGMLKWQQTLIPRSLTELEPENSKIAVQVHKSLLGYMGDKSMAFPATLAQDILQKGLEQPQLRDEIYLQVMKQLSSNPTADSIAKGWQVMCMCVSTFPPSMEFELYLLNFMHEQKKKKGAVRNYAKYCHRTLDGILASGASGFVPSVEEIQAYKERPPVLATVELVDGMLLTEELPVTPDLSVGKVVEICTHFLELTDPRSDCMGIFVYDVPPDPESNIPDPDADKPYADLQRSPRPLRNEDFMGDVIVQKARQKRDFKFVFKRKIFLPAHNEPSEDNMFSRLVYLQAEDEVITQGKLPIKSEESVVKLSSISYRVALDVDWPADAQAMCDSEDCPCIDFIPVDWRGAKEPLEWANLLLAQRDALLAQAPEELQQVFVEEVWSHELYGAHFFDVHKLNNDSAIAQALPTDLKIAFNANGMWVFDMSLNVLHSYGYADIYRWGGSSSQFSLIIWNQATESTFELKLSTAQAADMAGIILDYINAIMAAAQTDA
jgi:myosin heavy subunit